MPAHRGGRPRPDPPALLEVDTFADLATTIDVAAPLRNAEHARWRSLASSLGIDIINFHALNQPALD